MSKTEVKRSIAFVTNNAADHIVVIENGKVVSVWPADSATIAVFQATKSLSITYWPSHNLMDDVADYGEIVCEKIQGQLRESIPDPDLYRSRSEFYGMDIATGKSLT